MKYDLTNSDLISYAKAARCEHDAFYARWDGKRMYDPEYELRQQLAVKRADEARRQYVMSNPPGLHTHSVYFCFDSFPLEHNAKTIFHRYADDPDNEEDWISLDAIADHYEPLFPDMTFDMHGEDGTVEGTLADCERFVAACPLPVDIDHIDPDYLGHIGWDDAYRILGEPIPERTQHRDDTLITLQHFKQLLLRYIDDQGGEQLEKRWNEHFRNVVFTLRMNHELPHAEFIKWLDHYWNDTGGIDEVPDMLMNTIDDCIRLVEEAK